MINFRKTANMMTSDFLWTSTRRMTYGPASDQRRCCGVPLNLPLSKSYGARAAIYLRLIFPGSGNRAMSVKPAPGRFWHRGQQLIALSESNIRGNHLGPALVEEADRPPVASGAFAEPPQQGIFEMSGLAPSRNMLVTQLTPHGHDLGEPFGCVVALHNSRRHDMTHFAISSSGLRRQPARCRWR
jgi:hypothetical protein